MSNDVQIQVRADTDASRAALESRLFAQATGFDETPSRLIATAVSELARNILKYAGRGEIRLRKVEGGNRRGIEIAAVDRGPGIADLDLAMKDHFSSGGTLGLGLPGVRRLMDEFTLDSTVGEGTRVVATKWM